MRRAAPLGALLAIVLVALVTAGGTLAQEPVEVDGTADFRNPPRLTDGQYLDTIVTGEAVWYAVVYRNDEPYRVEVDLVGTDLEADGELELEARLIGPTLGDVDSGRVLEGSASYSGGTTNLWYIEVELSTTGRLGVEHTLSLDVSGMQSGRLDRCGDLPDCDLDEALAALDQEIADIAAAIAEGPTLETEEAVLEEVAALEARVAAATEARAAAADRIAAVCAPEPECDSPAAPSGSTPPWSMVLGALLLAAGAGFFASTFRRWSIEA